MPCPLSLALQELQKYEQFIFADHTNMIHVENVYEEILHQMLLDETLKGEEVHLVLEGTLEREEHLRNEAQYGHLGFLNRYEKGRGNRCCWGD